MVLFKIDFSLKSKIYLYFYSLLGPITKKDQLPEILVVIQICLEGQISNQSVQNSLARGMKNAGDLIPWNIFEQYGDQEFAKLAGARIVRIATHPNYQRVIVYNSIRIGN